MPDEDMTTVPEEQEENTVSVDLDEDDLESQMAATMAAESMAADDEDDLETQMAAAMAVEGGEGDVGSDDEEDDLEAQMAAAMAAADDDEVDGGSEEDILAQLANVDADGGGSAVEARPVEFADLHASDEIMQRENIDRLMDVTLTLAVELGRKKMQIKEILDLGPGKIIELDKLAGEPVDLLVNGRLLARGEVVVVDENFGVRITDLLNPMDRIKSLQ